MGIVMNKNFGLIIATIITLIIAVLSLFISIIKEDNKYIYYLYLIFSIAFLSCMITLFIKINQMSKKIYIIDPNTGEQVHSSLYTEEERSNIVTARGSVLAFLVISSMIVGVSIFIILIIINKM